MSFPRYAEYKNSGVTWLGEVPAHWTVSAIKWLSPVFRGASPRPIDDAKYFDDEGEYAWVRIADASASGGVLLETTQRLSELGSSLSVKLEPGSLFVSIAGTVGKPCITGVKACIHDGFVYFPRLGIDQRFLYRLFESGACYAGLGKMGTQLNLNTDTIGSIQIAVPPPTELQSLLLFLDHETAKIDTLIAEQEKLLALLAEKRQATISHAVTRGLDPNVPMKESGVPWLGQVPAHWEIRALRSIASGPECLFVDGDWIESRNISDEGIRYLTTGNVGAGFYKEQGAGFITERTFAELNCTEVLPGDMLISRLNLPIGRACVVPDLGFRIVTSVDNVVVRTNADFNRNFAVYRLTASDYLHEAANLASGATMQRISRSELGRIKLAFPPLPEQIRISEFLFVEIEKLDSLGTEAKKGIELLNERRSALISAAVTGKIDVRNAELRDVVAA